MKTKVLFLFIYLFALHTVFAQDYACIKPLDTVYFKDNNPFITHNYIHVPLIIKNTTISNDTIYHQNISEWAFRNITIAPDGITLFTNNSLDTISIHNQASLNDSWICYTSPTNYNIDYVEATVTEISTETFIGITDEVKTITLKKYYHDHDPRIMGEMKISKNYGFVCVPNLSIFPFESFMDILAFNDPDFDNFGTAEIFDFEVGDEFHTTEEIEKWFTDEGWDYYHTGVKKIAKVIEKNVSENGTTISYTYDVCAKSIFEIWNNSNSEEVTETIDMNKPEYACFNQISTTYHDYIDDSGYIKRILVGSDMDSKFIIGIQEGYDVNSLTQTFPDFYPNTPWGYAYHYKIGYGGPFYFHEYHMNWFESRYLTNHISCSHLLETEEISLINKLNIYPNPVNNLLNISLNDVASFSPYIVHITDITGKKHLELKQNTNEFSIDTTKLINGLYILQLISNKGIITRKFMVRH